VQSVDEHEVGVLLAHSKTVAYFRLTELTRATAADERRTRPRLRRKRA
jgi:hypothetical protein